jgi:PAS domain S-box-containing protein
MRRNASTHPGVARVTIAAATALAAVLALCGASTASYVSATRWVDRSFEVRRALFEWLDVLVDAETGARGYIATGDAKFLEPYKGAPEKHRNLAAQMRTLTEDTPEQAQGVGDAARDAETVMRQLRELVGLVGAGRRADAVERLAQGKVEMDAFRVDVRRLAEQDERALSARRAQANTGGWLMSIGATFLALGSMGLLGVAWRRERMHESVLSQLASRALHRLRVLSDLASGLAEARTRAQVAEVVIERGMLSAEADTCTLYSLDAAGATLELVADRGVAPDLVEKIRRITASSGNPTFATVASGEAMWAESDAEYAELHPGLAAMKTRRARAFWSVPLYAEGRPIGLLGAGFREPRRFSEDERAFIKTLAGQCAQAMLRASRMEREDEARSWLATTLRSIGDAVIATDATGLVTFMNPVAERVTGWSEADARGRPLDEVFCIFSEQTREVVESPVTKVLREGTVVGLANHTVLRGKRGVEVPIDDSGAPIRNESGAIVGVVLVFRDVTQEKRDRARSDFLARAGEALVASVDYEATLQTVTRLAVPTIADWCAVDLVDGPITRQVAVAHVDPTKVQFARELGQRYPQDPNASTGVAQVIRTGKSQLYKEIPGTLLDASARSEEHLRMLRELRLESAMTVALRTRGRIFGAMTFVYADSGRRYTEDDLGFAEDFARRAAMAIENALALKDAEDARENERWLRAEAELASRSKDEFLATVSHELRTPLNAILGWTVTLRRRNPAEDVDKALAVVERNARAQAKLIDDVLDISRIISGKLALRLGPTNVADVVRAAIETVTPAAEAKQIGMTAEVQDESLTITADADRTQQIVWNLLSNAVKFTPKGGRVSVRVGREGSDVYVRVTDTGEGIRAAVLPVIFEAFRQADASTTRRHGGLGLGLAIVKQLVAAHGGSVRAESEGPGCGATFVVELPARSAVAAVGRPSARTASTPDAARSVVAAPRIDGLRLLVVDDEHDALALVGEVLREQGAEVHVASSAHEAMAKLASVRPDVIVSDVGMPGVDGYALIRRIRALPPYAGGRTPAVALTAYAGAEDARRAFAAGYQMHVTKPVDPLHLATVIANLGGRTLADEG